MEFKKGQTFKEELKGISDFMEEIDNLDLSYNLSAKRDKHQTKLTIEGNSFGIFLGLSDLIDALARSKKISSLEICKELLDFHKFKEEV